MDEKYQDRINLCCLLLKVSQSFYEPGFIKEELCSSLTALKDYCQSDDFMELSDNDKSEDTIAMLYDTLQTTYPYFMRVLNASNSKCEQITLSEASEMLKRQYDEDESNGNGEIMNMNINEWVEKMGLKIVRSPKEDAQKN